jgi:hypothetical protein|tara:strand:+ start:9620 stop:9817 length:198 start_codon:yes stop_codon:yes gene_type:complete
MKYDLDWSRGKKKGICYICGKPTKLLIHKKCGKKADKTWADRGNPIKVKRVKKYRAGYLDYLSSL